MVVFYADRSIFKWNKNIFQNQNLAVKNTQVNGCLLYPKYYQGQSQEGVALGPMIIDCD